MDAPDSKRAGQLPEMSWSEVLDDLGMPRQTAAVLIGSGQNNVACDLGTTIVRVPRHPRAAHDLEREARITDAVRPFLSTPVPAIELRKPGNRRVSVHARIPGEPLSDLSELSDAQHYALARDLAEFLKEPHGIPLAKWSLAFMP